MEKYFDGHANKGGIYQIRNLINGKIYIGSTNSFKKRAYQHESRLNKNKHYNKHLLASWNKYGSNSFIFEVLEVVEGDRLTRTTREQEFLNEQIKLENWERCFNFSKKTTCRQGPWSKTPEETKKKRRKINKIYEYGFKKGHTPWHTGKTNVYSEETIKKMSEAKKGKNHWNYGKHLSKETKEKIGKASGATRKGMPSWKRGKKFPEHSGTKHHNSKTYNNIKLMAPDGTIYSKVECIALFAREHNLHQGHLSSLLLGKAKSVKGWVLLEPIGLSDNDPEILYTNMKKALC